MDTLKFSLPSYAKINWSLRVLGKRHDGYHEVRTSLQTISVQDEISFELNVEPEITLECEDPAIPTDETNLILKAANRLRHSNRSLGARITLRKVIPTKAGLGGGSSNAAVTLLGLARLWQLDVDSDELLAHAAQLGADVPFFLLGGCVAASGTGTSLKPLPDQAQRHLIVVTPSVSVSTQEAYRALKAPSLTSADTVPILAVSHKQSFFDDEDLWDAGENPVNDFERVIFDIEPEIKRAKTALLEVGATSALLAGSGSSVFGIFADSEAQQHATGMLKVENGWRVFPCVTIARDEYSRALGLGSWRSF